MIDDPLVSNKHLRIYTIIFDQENLEVAPLVYAQDLSLNGVHWNGYRIGKGNGGFLLSDGDILQVTHGISFQFRCGRMLGNPFCDTQIEEMEVSQQVPNFKAIHLLTNEKSILKSNMLLHIAGWDRGLMDTSIWPPIEKEKYN